MSNTIWTTGGQIPGPSRRERRCAKDTRFRKARATAWVIRKTGRVAEKMEVSRMAEVSLTTGEVWLSGREATTLLVCFGIPAICSAGDIGTGSRPSTVVIPRPKPFRRVSLQGECRKQRRLSAGLRGRREKVKRNTPARKKEAGGLSWHEKVVMLAARKKKEKEEKEWAAALRNQPQKKKKKNVEDEGA